MRSDIRERSKGYTIVAREIPLKVPEAAYCENFGWKSKALDAPATRNISRLIMLLRNGSLTGKHPSPGVAELGQKKSPAGPPAPRALVKCQTFYEGPENDKERDRPSQERRVELSGRWITAEQEKAAELLRRLRR